MLCNGSARSGHPGRLGSGLQQTYRGLSPVPSRSDAFVCFFSALPLHIFLILHKDRPIVNNYPLIFLYFFMQKGSSALGSQYRAETVTLALIFGSTRPGKTTSSRWSPSSSRVT